MYVKYQNHKVLKEYLALNHQLQMVLFCHFYFWFLVFSLVLINYSNYRTYRRHYVHSYNVSFLSLR